MKAVNITGKAVSLTVYVYVTILEAVIVGTHSRTSKLQTMEAVVDNELLIVQITYIEYVVAAYESVVV